METLTWRCWNITYTTTCTATSVWLYWAAGSVSCTTDPEIVRQVQEGERKRKAALERATAYLREHLDEAQREQFDKERHFEVLSRDGRRRYRVAHNVVYEVNKQGERLRSFCIHPRESYPEPDNMLAKKLLLEADETEFLRIANKTELIRQRA